MALTNLSPINRIERFLNKIATGGSTELNPIRRFEYWLDKIAGKVRTVTEDVSGISGDVSELDERVSALEESGGGMLIPLEVSVDTSGASEVITLTDPSSAFSLDTLYDMIVSDGGVVTWNIHTIIDNDVDFYSQVAGCTISRELVDDYYSYTCDMTYIVGDVECYEIVLNQDDSTFVWDNHVSSFKLYIV